MNKLRELTYKQKNVLLIVSAVILALLSYYRGISTTLSVMNDVEELEGKLEKAENASTRIASMKADLAAFQRIIGDRDGKDSDVQQRLLEKVTEHADRFGMTVKDFPEPHRYSKKDLAVLTYPVTMKGDFSELLELVHELERNFSLSNVSSLEFFTKKDLRTKRKKLYGKIHLQHVRKR